MKVILFLFIFIPTCLFSQWNVISSTQRTPINGAHIWATSESVVHLATDEHALKSTDGGHTWKEQKLPSIQNDISTILRGIYFTSPLEGYIFGGLNANQYGIWKTTDGGEIWSLEIFPIQATFASFRAMQFVNTTGFLVGDNGAFYKTTDNGNTWNPIVKSVFEGEDLIALHFLDEQTGFVFLGNAGGYKTTDGGNTWVAIDHPFWGYEVGFRFFDEQNGVGWGSRDGIYTTDDGGITWEKTIEDLSRPESMWWFSTTEWLALQQNGQCYKTVDGGEHWALQNEVNTLMADELFFINEEIGWFTARKAEENVFSTQNRGGLAILATLEKERDCVGDSLYLTSTVMGTTQYYWKIGAEKYTEEPNFVYRTDARQEYVFTLVAESENQLIEQSLTFTPRADPLNRRLIFATDYDTVCEKEVVLFDIKNMAYNTDHRIAVNGTLLEEKLQRSSSQTQWKSEVLDTTTVFTLYSQNYFCGLVEQIVKTITVVEPPNENISFTFPRNPICARDSAIIVLEVPEQGVAYQAFSNEMEQSIRSIADNTITHSIVIPDVLESTNYSIEASKSAGCTVKLKDSLDLAVIQLDPTFAAPSINIPINEPIQIQNTSADSLTFDWRIGNGTIDTKQQPNPVSFSTVGSSNIELEVTSTYGCKETENLEITTYDPANLSETWISKHSGFPYNQNVETFKMNVDGADNMYYVVDQNKTRYLLPYSLQTQAGPPLLLDVTDQYIVKNNKLGVLQWAAQVGTNTEASFSIGNLSFKPNNDLIVPISYRGVIYIKGADGKIYESPANTGIILAQFNPNGALTNTILLESYQTPTNCAYSNCFKVNTVQVDETGTLFLAGKLHINKEQPEFYITVGNGVRSTYEALEPPSEETRTVIYSQFVAKINPNNEIAWVKPYSLSHNFNRETYGFSPDIIQSDKAGGLYIWSSGTAREGNATYIHHAVALTRLNDQGEKLWDRFGETFGKYMYANFMEVDKNGEAIIAGTVEGYHRMGDYKHVQTINGSFFGKVSKEGKVKWLNYIQSGAGLPSVINNSYAVFKENAVWGLSLDNDLLYLRSVITQSTFYQQSYRTFPVCNAPNTQDNRIVSIWDLEGNGLQFIPFKHNRWIGEDNTDKPLVFTAKNGYIYMMGFTTDEVQGMIGTYSIPHDSLGNAYAARIPDNQKYLPYITRPFNNVADCYLQVCENNLQPLKVSALFTDIQWHLDGIPISGATSAEHFPEISGNYTVQATNPIGERVNTLAPTSVDVHRSRKIDVYQIEDHLTTSLAMDFYIWSDATTGRVVHAGNPEIASKFYPETAGEYYLLGDLRDYCLEQSETFTYEGVISATNESALGGLEWNVFPNPSKDFVYLQFSAPKKEDYWQVRVYDMLQKEIMFQQIDHQNEGMQFQLDASVLPAGTYSIHIEGASRLQSGTENIVIVK